MTIRRDLDVLAEQGMLQRVGAGPWRSGPAFAQRFSRQARAKDCIAAKLAGLVATAVPWAWTPRPRCSGWPGTDHPRS